MSEAASTNKRPALLSRVVSWPPHHVFLFGFLIGGMLLCGGSALLHIDNFKTPKGSPFSCESGAECIGRQVGYLWAPNWSLTYAILGPLALFLMIEALRGINSALNGLFDMDMVRGERMAPIRKHLSAKAWFEGSRIRDRLFFVCSCVLPVAIAYSEWWTNNLMRLMNRVCAGCHPSDYDWGLAGIISPVRGLLFRSANAAFDFVAFSCEALLLSVSILFFLYMLDIRQVLPTRDGRVKGRLLPNLRSSDPRRGFEKFERPLQLMLVVSLTFYLICYSIHVNRVYMRSQGFSSIGAFIQSDILGLVDSIPTGPGKAKALLSFLFGMQPSEWQRQDYYGDAAQLFVSIFSLIVISETVGRAASRAKEDAEDYYARDTARSLFGLPIETERDRLRKMTTWPLEWRYFRLFFLVAWMFVAVVSLYYYRLGLYVFLLILVTILSWAAKRS